MTESEFQVCVNTVALRSLPLLEACRAVLVRGESQYSVSRTHGIDQAQISKACGRVKAAPLEAVRRAVYALNDLAPFDDMGCYSWELGSVDALDMRLALRELLERLERGHGGEGHHRGKGAHQGGVVAGRGAAR